MTPSTDGPAVDPGTTGTSSWDSILSEGITATGLDPSQPLPTDAQEPAASPAPQQVTSGSEDGAKTPATPSLPAETAAGQPAPAPTPDAEQIPDTKPFTFTVDGKERSIEGVYVLPGEGLYVPEAKIPHFQLLASQGETLQRTNRELYDQHKSLERLTEWKQQGPDGKEQTLTGRDAIEASRVRLGEALAEAHLLRQIIEDPNKLAELLVFDEQTRAFSHQPLQLRLLQSELRDLKNGVTQQVRQQFGAMASAPPPPVPSLNQAEITERAPATVEAVIDAAKVTGLTPEDKAALSLLVPRYSLTVTRENQAQYPQSRVGETVFDYPGFLPIVKDRAALRAQAVAAQKTTTDVSKFNGGMGKGRQVPKAPPAAAKAPTGTVPTQKRGKAEQWDDAFQEAMEGISI